ncbi:hypothetical protein L484_017814 [Morus notabilis]|uniref:Uncharacterized protein n=1 Tax=Morus notabilis TaxID=981085 RepID=W9RC11_9ROSA|nr:hypothetical protein L484_017814 [Morus notabilis]
MPPPSLEWELYVVGFLVISDEVRGSGGHVQFANQILPPQYWGPLEVVSNREYVVVAATSHGIGDFIVSFF